MPRKNIHKYTSNFVVKDARGKKWTYSGGSALTFHGDFRPSGMVNLLEKNKIQNIRYYNGSAKSDVPYRHIFREYPNRGLGFTGYGGEYGSDDAKKIAFVKGEIRKLHSTQYDTTLPTGLAHTGDVESLGALRISQGDGIVFDPGNAIKVWENGNPPHSMPKWI